MRSFNTPLPIDAVLGGLTTALAGNNAAVLVAPPGAGKTTRVPLVLIDEPWAKDKKILVLEPRRLAARAAAARMASTLGEQVGDTVGLRVRGRHRRRVHAAGAGRSLARRHRRRVVRRIS
jgi:ATP-dependent helicase HrpB